MQGEYDEAEPLYELSLRSQDVSLGQNDPKVARRVAQHNLDFVMPNVR